MEIDITKLEILLEYLKNKYSPNYENYPDTNQDYVYTDSRNYDFTTKLLLYINSVTTTNDIVILNKFLDGFYNFNFSIQQLHEYCENRIITSDVILQFVDIEINKTSQSLIYFNKHEFEYLSYNVNGIILNSILEDVINNYCSNITVNNFSKSKIYFKPKINYTLTFADTDDSFSSMYSVANWYKLNINVPKYTFTNSELNSINSMISSLDNLYFVQNVRKYYNNEVQEIIDFNLNITASSTNNVTQKYNTLVDFASKNIYLNDYNDIKNNVVKFFNRLTNICYFRDITTDAEHNMYTVLFDLLEENNDAVKEIQKRLMPTLFVPYKSYKICDIKTNIFTILVLQEICTKLKASNIINTNLLTILSDQISNLVTHIIEIKSMKNVITSAVNTLSNGIDKERFE